jgi:transcriptional regulator with XRE-family HTH domain
LRNVTGGQLRAARALLRMDQSALALAAGVSVPTIKRVESSDDEPSGTFQTISNIIGALEVAGVEFIPENGGGVGVRLKHRRAPDQGKTPDELTTENDG